jgi:hypothetical protein
LLRALGQVSQKGDRALQPSTGDGDCASPGVVEGQMESHERSGPHITFLDESGIGALSRCDALLEVPHPERSLAESFHIARLERTGVIGL